MDGDIQSRLKFLQDNMATKGDLNHLRKETNERFERVEHRLDNVEHRLDNVEHRLGNVEHRLDNVEHRLDDMTEVLLDIRGIVLNIENNFDRRIESLYDGYKLQNEKIEDLTRRVDRLEEQQMAL